MSTYPSPQSSLPSAYAAAAPQAMGGYGPVGSVPSGPGVVYFGEQFGVRHRTMVQLAGGGFCILLGLALLQLSGIAAVICVLIGALLAALGWSGRKKVVHRDVICDINGITLREGTQAENRPSLAVAWAEIQSAVCDTFIVTTTTNEGDANIVHHRLTLRANSGAVMTMDDATMKGLPELVTLTAQHMPQLPYRWMPAKEAKGLPVDIRAGKYSRVPR